jgi:hypothetical protein
MSDLETNSASIRYDTFESKDAPDRVYGITQTLFHEPYYQRHFISHPRVTRDGSGYSVRANYPVVRTKHDALRALLAPAASSTGSPATAAFLFSLAFCRLRGCSAKIATAQDFSLKGRSV